jgi:hypothetical protein
MLQALEHSTQYAGLGPAAHTGIYGMPSAKTFGQTAPFAPLFSNVQDGIQNLQVRETDIATLARQAILDQAILLFGDLHAISISYLPISMNTP